MVRLKYAPGWPFFKSPNVSFGIQRPAFLQRFDQSPTIYGKEPRLFRQPRTHPPATGPALCQHRTDLPAAVSDSRQLRQLRSLRNFSLSWQQASRRLTSASVARAPSSPPSVGKSGPENIYSTRSHFQYILAQFREYLPEYPKNHLNLSTLFRIFCDVHINKRCFSFKSNMDAKKNYRSIYNIREGVPVYSIMPKV